MSVYDEILSNSNIVNILEYYGLRVNRNKCICPFHNDTHPSMSIHPQKGIAKCFACGAGGNAISFIQKYENEINHNPITLKDAMKKAIEIQGLNIAIEDNNITLTTEQKENQRLNNILKDAIQVSENTLDKTDYAIEYLKSRNLSIDIIKFFHIGFDSNLDNELQRKFKYTIGDLEKVGLVSNKDNLYIDVFSNRITIPIFDENGNPVGFGARTITSNIKPKYINTKETDLFNKSKVLFNYHKAKYYARNDEIIIVEGYMDVISSKAMKMDNVVGIMGTALTKEQINLIKKLNCEITLCLDNDQAGKDAMIRIIPELLNENLKVNVLDISKLGNYKDFGDLNIANISRESLYQTKISAFTFLLQYKYIQNNELTVETIHSIYNKMWKDGFIKDTKDILNFREYISKNSNYSIDEIDKIIEPTEIEKTNSENKNRVNRYKDVYFYYYIVGLIKSYANTHQDSILLKYIESGKLNSNFLVETLDNEKFLRDNELTIDIKSYVNECIYKSNDYIEFKNNKIFILENLLNNAKSYDSKGNIIDISLTIEQKELIIKQYNETFNSDIKNYIENNPDEFEEIFISNSSSQFEKLFPKTYEQIFKEQAITRYNNGAMEAIRYALAYKDDMKSVMSRQYVNNDKYKTLLVFNNNKNILNLSEKNIKEPLKEETKEINKTNEITEITKDKKTSPMSIFISLSGNERETFKGIYLPTSNDTQVFIPKQLYKKDGKKIEILNNKASQANMSEYKIDLDNQTKKWNARLSLDEFYKKYFKIYEVQREKEVMA